MSLLSKPEQVNHVLTNLFSDHPDIVSEVKIDDWNTLPKLMKADLNTINSLKTKDGKVLKDILNDEKLEVLKAGISFLNYKQIEHGELNECGRFDIDDGVDAQALSDWIDNANDHVKYTAKAARARTAEKAQQKAMEEEAKLKLEILRAELQAAQQAQSNRTNLGAGSGGNSGSSGSGGGQTGGNQGLSSNQGGNQGLKPDTVIEKMPVLSDLVNFTTWEAEVKTIATAAQCANVLDENYQPDPNDAAAVTRWKVRQSIMYLAFKDKLKTSFGKTLVMQYVATGDAQMILKDLRQHYNGAGSVINTSVTDSLRDKVTTPCPEVQRGLMSERLERWFQDFLLYDKSRGNVTPSDEKLRELERFVQHWKSLAHVKTMQSVAAGMSASPQTPEQVIALYKQEALRIDIARKKEVLGKRGKIAREVHYFNSIYHGYSTEFYIDPNLGDERLDDEDWFHVFAAASARPGFIPSEVFGQLTKEERKLWRGLDPDTRELILSARSKQQFTIQGPADTKAGSRIKTAPKSGTNPTSRYKSGTDPRRKGPVNNRARVNVTEQERVDANVAEFRRLHINSTEGLYDESTSFLDSVRASQANPRVDINQTSQLPPFHPQRFLSVPEDDADDTQSTHSGDSQPSQGADDVEAGDDDANAEVDEGNEATDASTDDADRRAVQVAEGDHDDSTTSGEYYDDDEFDSDDDIDWQIEMHDLHHLPRFSEQFICAHETLFSTPMMSKQTYRVTRSMMSVISGMIDRGANGGVSGDSKFLRTISVNHDDKIDIVGIDNHTISSVEIGSVGGVAKVVGPDGPMEVLCIFHNYALHGRGKPIHSAFQLEAFRNQVDDRAIQFGGKQTITTPQGLVFPLDVRNGLVHLPTRAFTDDEWKNLPHVTMTSPNKWNPNIANSTISDDPNWYASQPQPSIFDDNFNIFGEYLNRTTTAFSTETTTTDTTDALTTPPFVTVIDDTDAEDASARMVLPTIIPPSEGPAGAGPNLMLIDDAVVEYTGDSNLESSHTHPFLHEVKEFGATLVNRYSANVVYHQELPTDFESLRQFFLFAPREVVQHTFNSTTRYYENIPAINRIRETIRTHFPAANVDRRHEMVATDTLFFDVQCGGGTTCAQFFIGRRSYFISIYGMRTDGDFINALEDEIRNRGAMEMLFSDNAQAEISRRVEDLLRHYRIKDRQSEPHYQQQNIAERFIQELKKLANRVRNTSGCPPEMILHVLQYVAFIWNRTARRMLGWRTPIEALTGQTPDISQLLHFHFWEVVYISNYQQREGGFPSQSNEIMCRFIGYSETVGHSMTFKVWNPATRQVLYRSRLRKATDNDADHPANDGDDDAPPPGYDGGEFEEAELDDYERRDGNGEDNGTNQGNGNDGNSGNNLTEGGISSRERTGSHAGATGRGRTGRNGEDSIARRTRSRGRVNPQPSSIQEEPPRGGTQPVQAPRSTPRPTSGSTHQTVQPTASTDPTVRDPLPPASEAVLNSEFLSSCIGRYVLLNTQEDGQRFRAKIVRLIEDFEGDRDSHPDRIKFECEVGDKKFQEIVDYNDMCSFIEEQLQEEDGTWRFRRITGHTIPRRKNETIKVLIEWESGEITLEPVYNIGKADPWVLAEYAQKNGLVDRWNAIWPSLKIKKHAKNEKKLVRSLKAAQRASYKHAPKWMYGHRVPANHDEAMRLDKENGNDNWKKSEILEKNQLLEYNTFEDRGHKSTAIRPGPEYTKIDLHIVYAVKHDGRYKSRIVAGGHMTQVPLESVYSGVVSLRGVRFVIFLAELNDLELYQTDVGNAYLESYTREKVWVIGGPELHELKDHVLIIVKSLYGLKSSGLRWHERFADVLRDMGFTPSIAEPDIWMRAMDRDGNPIKVEPRKPAAKSTTLEKPVPLEDGSYYEYIAVYTDDLTIAAKDAKAITDTLVKKYKFKLKGTNELNFLLGCDYFREGKTLCASPRKYIEKMEDNYVRWFGKKPTSKVSSPLESNDHPELDTSDFLSEKYIKIYQSMIGSAQWLISLGRFDISVHVMTLSSFRAKPRQGHLDRIKRVYGYVCKMKHAAIRFRTEMPDVTDFTFAELDWNDTPFRDAREEFPTNLPVPRGKPVLMTTYVDANLGHDVLSGKSVTGILHFLNKTPIDWFSKKQGTVETATFGSENNAARAATEQITANKLALMHMGVPIKDNPILLGDNDAVVKSDTQPKGKLHKRHLMLSYNFVREAIAARRLRFSHINGAINMSDVLSKHWAYQAVWDVLKPVLFWRGDTMKIGKKEKSTKSTKRTNRRGVTKEERVQVGTDSTSTMYTSTSGDKYETDQNSHLEGRGGDHNPNFRKLKRK